ncbi:MAG: superoxide dismutase [bacterium]|nr:superoxide dismutase [bacterium]
MPYELPKLPYAYDALEPYLDARTMELHHAKHHATYVEKLNAALDGQGDLAAKPLDALLRDITAVPEAIRMAVKNHGGGHHNHSLFWKLMKKNGGGDPSGPVSEAITQSFGDIKSFRDAFTKAAVGVFGSGWAWLVIDVSEKISIITTPNQDSPLMQGFVPLLGLDVWEHAYYLKYQNRRPEYVEAWWHVVNWDQVAENFDAAM